MIRVTIELLPGGSEKGKRILGVAILSNDVNRSIETGGEEGSYNVKLSKFGGFAYGTWKQGKVDGFDRVNRGAFDLLFIALRKLIGKRNPDD